ncbi:DUF6252 family protein [Arundinibacter roseus]|uniref:Lipoprotein n=1 Tax=Arundinibacter roseus TaxID=2070510 RepID=A0A4R4JWJ2_9BACT|nr:DUF6252 family protein [Arundinibacter roseus]TDB59128.1 hypothetical protein EZE20_22625 [Arundinibacter roseus]
MNGMKLLSICASISLTLMAGTCGKKTEDVPPVQSGVTMKVDGVSWSGQVIAQMIDSETLVVNAINASASSQETVGIVIEKVNKTGSYPIKVRTGNGFLFSRNAVIYSGDADGQVEVTAINTAGGKTVPKGTFRATCLSKTGAKVVITDGKF